MKKTIFTAIIGRANTGKSTLLNTLLGEKIAIVSNKPQTTRTKITGITSRGDTQYVFLDTPGRHKPQDKLGSFMMRAASDAATGVDLILYIVSAGDRIGPIEENLMKRFKEIDVPVVLLVNKTDISRAEQIGDTILRFSGKYDFAAVIPISAKNGDNTSIIFDEIDKYATETDEWIFPDDMITDQPERQIAAEFIREKLLRLLNEEIPHGVAVVIEEWKETPKLLSIRAEIFCEKASHKPIIIGKGGATLKKVGEMAREDLEAFFGMKVYLDLWVKVKENWRESDFAVSNLGFKREEF